MSVVERERVEVETQEDAVANDVALAAIWMDAEYPGWADRIDTDALDLSRCPTCIIGQAASEDDWLQLWREYRLDEYLRGCAGTGVAPFSSNDSKPYWLAEIAKRA